MKVTTRVNAGDVDRGDTSDMAASLVHADIDGCQELFRRQQSFLVPMKTYLPTRHSVGVVPEWHEEVQTSSWTSVAA